MIAKKIFTDKKMLFDIQKHKNIQKRFKNIQKHTKTFNFMSFGARCERSERRANLIYYFSTQESLTLIQNYLKSFKFKTIQK